jgi:pSer/pThr/pTyr-binding forkhead associated (FHA) protein
VIVCPRCKTENADGRIRCGKCGNNISKRGEYSQKQGPEVIVFGSVEDLRRAKETGNLDTSNDDPTALGWLENSDLAEAEHAAAPPVEAKGTRRVSVREIDKISGLKDLREIQKALLQTPETPTEKPRVKIELERRRDPDASPTQPVKVEPAVAWLACELLPGPIPLVLGKKFLLGRDERAPIRLQASEVSRRHCGVAADEKGDFYVEDLRSSNGTYVNGHQILKRRLKDGDVLDVGPFTFRFSLGATAPVAASDPNAETRTIRAVPGALVGEIESNGAGSVLVLLHTAKRSGVLTLRAGPQVGRIFLVDGEIQHAQFGKVTGEQALAALIPAEAGFLHFADEKVKVKRTIERSTAEILGI